MYDYSDVQLGAVYCYISEEQNEGRRIYRIREKKTGREVVIREDSDRAHQDILDFIGDCLSLKKACPSFFDQQDESDALTIFGRIILNTQEGILFAYDSLLELHLCRCEID